MVHTIDTVDGFFAFVEKHSLHTGKTIFRGHDSADYKLWPSIGRIGKAITDERFDTNEEKKMINSYIKKANQFLKSDFSGVEAMTIAQHHRVPTRLLDWTWNPLVAAFFAIRNDDFADKDGAIFYLDSDDFEFKNRHDRDPVSFDPFDLYNDIVLYEPKNINSRITAQSGLFSIHKNPNKEVDDPKIQKVILSCKIKEELGVALETMGVHAANLFPGLDGTGEHIKWLYIY